MTTASRGKAAAQSSTQINPPYAAVSVQTYWENYNSNLRGKFEGATFKKRNLQRMCDHIDACFTVGANPLPVKLICFPEFSIGGLYTPRTTTQEVKRWQAITMPGPETEVLAKKAREYDIYIAACNHENDPAVPDNFFNTAFIISPKGKIILKYRKLNTAFSCDPHDIYDKYVNPITGTRDFFPVVDTKIGRLACFICGDIQIPEIPRMYAIKGAEVLCHLNSGYAGELPRQVLRVRAWDNTIYIVEENWAARVLATEPLDGTRISISYDSRGGGQAMVIDFLGNVIAQADDKTPQLVQGMINIMALRDARTRMRRGALPGDAVPMTRTELYKPFYSKTIFPPNQVLVDGPMKTHNDASVLKRRQTAVENRLKCMDYYSEDSVK